MEKENQSKTKIQTDIRELAKTIHELSLKYNNEPLIKNLQSKFLSLSVNIGKELNIHLA